MFRLLFSLIFLLAAACASQKPPITGPVEAGTGIAVPEEPAESTPVPVETPDIVDQVPGACELLLLTLQETQPMLRELDENLAWQAERFDAALGRMPQPAPGTTPPECPEPATASIGNKEIIGAIEWIYLDPPGRHYRARLDSVTDTSALSASDIVQFERDGDDWVRFVFQHENSDEPVNLELPIKRTLLVRPQGSKNAQRRVVVEIDVRLGRQLHTTEFVLTDRQNMAYPILLGRAFLMDLYVIDVSRSYTRERYDPS